MLYHFVLVDGVSNCKVTGVSPVADKPMGREALASEKVNLSDSKRVGESPSLIAATPLCSDLHVGKQSILVGSRSAMQSRVWPASSEGCGSSLRGPPAPGSW